jgi:hypothetical protein
MKYSLLVVAFLTLTPCLVYAQNQQFSDCGTLEMAGNFIGADEALMDGLVCRVGKPKTSVPASRPAAAKAAEGSKALLGIIEPEILRSKEKAGASQEQGLGARRPHPEQRQGPSQQILDRAEQHRLARSSRIQSKALGKSRAPFARIRASRSRPSPNKVTWKERSPLEKKLIG